jgi:drug/metabolite transporter (DMT)-like permease
VSAQDLGHASALACAALWAVSTVLFGAAAQSVSARALNLLKCSLAAALLCGTALVLGDVPALSSRDTIALSVSAVLGIVIADTAYFVALKHLGAARGVLFVSLVPVCTSLAAVPMLGEALTARMLLGMALTLTGVVVVVRARSPSSAPSASTLPGIVGGVVYCTAQALANVLTKSADPSLSPLALSAFRLLVGASIIALSLVVTARGRAEVRALKPVLPRGSLATLCGAYFGLLLGTYALRTVTAGIATTLIATTPLFAMVIARVIGKETPLPRMLLGAVVALAGVALLVL